MEEFKVHILISLLIQMKNLISWQSKRIKRMVRRYLAAEALVMLDGIDSVLYIAALLNELINYKLEQKILIHYVINNNFVML